MKLKASYKLSEFALMTGDSHILIKRRADRGEIPTFKIGRDRHVGLVDLQELMPKLWASIVLRLQVMAAAGQPVVAPDGTVRHQKRRSLVSARDDPHGLACPRRPRARRP